MALNERPRGFSSDLPIGSGRGRGSLQTLSENCKSKPNSKLLSPNFFPPSIFKPKKNV